MYSCAGVLLSYLHTIHMTPLFTHTLKLSQEEWKYLQCFSSYHNIDPAQVTSGLYPPLLMTTSTRDDRVHPYHARCFSKRLIDTYSSVILPTSSSSCSSGVSDGSGGSVTGGSDSREFSDRVLYFENIEGTYAVLYPM